MTQALSGLGGVGKTQLVLEYVYRHVADFERVWWIAAEDRATLGRDLEGLGRELGILEEGIKDQDAAIAAVRRWLEGHGEWLLVFDNAPDAESLREVLPRGGGGQVLITSRSSDWGRVGSLSVAPFEREESLGFFARRRGLGGASPVEARLAAELGDLPLALEQAAAYLEQTGISVERYLELLGERRRDLLERGVPEDYPDAVASTWEVSFRELEVVSPPAAALVQLCAFLAPDDIPLGLVSEGGEKLEPPLSEVAADPVALLDAVVAARRFSLLESLEGAVSMHRLVQWIARDRCPGEERRKWARTAVALVNAGFRYDKHDLETWPMAGRLLPHAQVALGYLGEGEGAVEAARLWNETGLYLLDRGVLAEALVHLEASLALAEGIHGPDHNEVAICANNIGLILKAQGDLAGALEYARRALRIGEVVYGPDHPTVAIYANNIGQILQAQGDLVGAREHLVRALAILETVYGPDNPSTVTVRGNLESLPGEEDPGG